MEFKGTKDKEDWKYEHDGDGMRFKGISVYVDDCYENYRADSRLISKAPELLEMLQMILDGKIRPREYESEFKMVKQLIKEATTP